MNTVVIRHSSGAKGLGLFPALTLALVLFVQGCEKPAEPATPANTSPIRGTITLSQAAQSEPGNILYIIARSSGMGPPVAVKRIPNPAFPLVYSLGPEDSMVPGIPFQGPFSIKARLSRTGDAMPKPGDLEGVYAQAVNPGTENVDIHLAQILSEGVAPSMPMGQTPPGHPAVPALK